ncbi:MAG: F0F1 ATP synthase subunit B [Planctomycetales bacterium]
MKRLWQCSALLAGLTLGTWGLYPGQSCVAADPPKAAAEHHETKPAEGKAPAEAGAHGDAGAHKEAGHGDGAHEQRGPIEVPVDLALWSLVTFGVFLLVLTKMAWNPLMTGLSARETGILKNIQDAEVARLAAQKSLADYQAKLATAEAQVDQMLAEARRNAEVTRQEMLAATEQDVKNLKDRALAEIDQVRGQALEQLFSHVANLVTNATEHVLERSLTDADHQRLVSDAVTKFSTKG